MFLSVCLFLCFLIVISNYVPIPLIKTIQRGLFELMYRLYCSELVGYKVLKNVMHPSSPIPHSDYRAGVRCLHQHNSLPRWKPKREANPNPNISAAQQARLRNKTFYGVGGPAVDIRSLHHMGDAVKSEGGILVVPIPIFNDNYAYGIISLKTQKMALVDPADDKTCLVYLKRFRAYTGLDSLQLTEILTTHKHWDHAGGNGHILEYAKSKENSSIQLVSEHLSIIGPTLDNPHACNKLVNDKDVFPILEEGATVKVVAAPGHTVGSVLYSVADITEHSSDYLAVFTGDAIFCGGCGNPFELQSINDIFKTRDSVLKELLDHPRGNRPMGADRVLLYVGHEYTARLLLGHRHCMTATKKSMNPDEKDKFQKISRYIDQIGLACFEVEDLRRVVEESETEKKATLPLCTVPSTVATEKCLNPLLTATDESLATAQLPGESLSRELLEEIIYAHPDRQ